MPNLRRADLTPQAVQLGPTGQRTVLVRARTPPREKDGWVPGLVSGAGDLPLDRVELFEHHFPRRQLRPSIAAETAVNARITQPQSRQSVHEGHFDKPRPDRARRRREGSGVDTGTINSGANATVELATRGDLPPGGCHRSPCVTITLGPSSPKLHNGLGNLHSRTARESRSRLASTFSESLQTSRRTS